MGAPAEHAGAPARPPGRLRRIAEPLTGPWNRANLLGWVVVIALVLAIRWLWFTPYAIPSDSMMPTLDGDPRFLLGDRVAVDKFVYGPRWPFTQKRIFDGQAPQRWEIVVFDPVDGSGGPALVKRIAGLPGERVRIESGRLHVNGRPVEFPEHMPKDVAYINNRDIDLAIQNLPGDAQREYLEKLREKYPFRYGCVPEEQYTLIPEGHYFMLGDNTWDSVDSRYYGWIPEDHLIGRVFCVWWPLDHWRDFTGFSRTWWGKLLLYGVPAALVLYECGAYFRRRRTLPEPEADAHE